jgi:hypothetical protein
MRQPERQLNQCQRVAARLGDDAVADPHVQRRGEHRVQQGACIVLGQPLQHQFRQSRAIAAGPARSDHQTDGFGLQPAGHESQDLSGGAIEPLLVVHHADQRALLGDVGEQTQHRQGQQEPVGRRAGGEAERDPQCSALWHRESVEMIEHRRAQLMHPRECQLHLRLDAGGARHQAARCEFDRVFQQRGLAHARFASHHQRPALTRADVLDQPAEDLALFSPAHQARHGVWCGETCGGPPGNRLH